MMFDKYLARWQLTPEGQPIVTPTSRLLAVRAGDVSAILKIAVHEEEKRANALMSWWAGRGAAPVLAQEANALLMERAQGSISLADMARGGRDDDATRIMCAVLDELHAPRERPLPDLVPLAQWFEPLRAAAHSHDGNFRASAYAASKLLANPREIAVLHGDMHHGNVLTFGARGWRAIDPKGLVGERYFDYANILSNPDHELATAPGRLGKQVNVIADAARLDPARLRMWVVAWAGLSAAFSLQDGESPEAALAITEFATAEMHG
jgi:streptomycin 6-kinase